MNLPNQLTVLRLILTFAIVGILSSGMPWAKSISLIFFCIASFTDFLDGYIARKKGLITNFGKLMDPLADKVLMCGGFVLLTSVDLIPAWIVVVILAREFLVTGLRLVASAEGVVLAAESLGKYKTVFQIITIIYFLLYLATDEPVFAWVKPLFAWKPAGIAILGNGLIYISLALTVLSGLSYALKNRKLLADC